MRKKSRKIKSWPEIKPKLIKSEKDLLRISDDPGNKNLVKAVKSIRMRHGLGLKEAKALCDKYRTKLNLPVMQFRLVPPDTTERHNVKEAKTACSIYIDQK